MFKKPNVIPGFLNVSGFVNEEPKYDDKQRPFSITSNLHENAFNWENVYNWDPVQIKQEHDAEKMQDILNKFVKCNFTSADLQIIQNPLIFRLLQVLQIVVEYIAHSQTEVQTLYGKAVHENTVLKTSLSRYKTKNGRLISALKNMKEVEKCPVCSSYFDSDISLDRHIHKNHFKVYDLWSHVRENKEFSVQEEVKDLNRQIDAMRILIKEQQKRNKNPPKIPKEEKQAVQKEEENTKESTDQPNIFVLSDSNDDEKKDNDSSKKYKYYIDPDYQPFHKAVHHDDGPYLVFQEMSDLSISIEPQAVVEQRTKKGTDNIYYQKAKLFLDDSSQKDILKSSNNDIIKNEKESKNNINLNYDDISDSHKIRTGKQIKIDVHDQAHEVKMSYMEKGPKWRLRKKVEKELKEQVPDSVPKSTIHQLFDKLNFYSMKKNEKSAESESIEEEEEDKKEEEEIELTSACYSSLQYSSERAQYYSHDGGGTTRKEQAHPSLYNPGGRKFPLKSEVHQPDKNTKEKFDKAEKNSENVFEFQSSSEPKSDNNLQNQQKNKEENKKDKESSTSFFSTQDSQPPPKPPTKPDEHNIGLLSEGSFLSTSDDIFFNSKKNDKTTPSSLVTSSNKKKEQPGPLKSSSQNWIEEEEEPSDEETKSKPKFIPKRSDSDEEPIQSVPVSHRRKKIRKSKSKSSTNDTTISSQKSSKSNIKISSSNLQDQIEVEFEEEEKDEDQISKSQKTKRKPSKIDSENSFDKEEEKPKSMPVPSHRKKIRKSRSKGSTNDTTISSQKSSKSNIKISSSNLQDQIEIEEEEMEENQIKKTKKNDTNMFDSENSFDKEENDEVPKSFSHHKKKKGSKNKISSPSKFSKKSSKDNEDARSKNSYEFDSISWDD